MLRPLDSSFDERINLMFDLVALAYQANMTRVFTFMVAAEVSGQTYNHIGVPDAFHPLSHHNNEQGKMERLAKVQAYHTQVFAKFLDKLDKMPDGDGQTFFRDVKAPAEVQSFVAVQDFG